MADKKWSEVDKISSFSDCARLPILDTKCCDPESEDNVLTNYTIAVLDFLNGVNIKISKLEEDCSTVQEQIAQIEQNIEDITQADFDEKIRLIDEKLDEAEQTLADIQSELDSNAYVKYTDIKQSISEIDDCTKEVPSMCLIRLMDSFMRDVDNTVYNDLILWKVNVNQTLSSISIRLGLMNEVLTRLINFWNRTDITSPYTRSFVFDSKAELDALLESSSFIENLREGDAFYITAAGSQDYYWDGHLIQPIENPTDLSDYVTKEELLEVVDNETSHYGRYVGYNLQAQVEDFPAQVTQPHSEVFNDYLMVYNETTKEFETNDSYSGQKITDDYSTAHGKGNTVGCITYGTVYISPETPSELLATPLSPSDELDLYGKYVYISGTGIPTGSYSTSDISGYYKLIADTVNNTYKIYLSTSYTNIILDYTTSDIYLTVPITEEGTNHVSGSNNIVQGEANLVSGIANKISGIGNTVSGELNEVFNSRDTIVSGHSNNIDNSNKIVDSDNNKCSDNIIVGSNNILVDSTWGSYHDLKYILIFGDGNLVEDSDRVLVGGLENIVANSYPFSHRSEIVYGYKNYCSASYTNIFGRFNQHKGGYINRGDIDSFIAGTNNFTLNKNEIAFGVRNVSFNPQEKDPNYTSPSNTTIFYDDPDHEETLFTIGNGNLVDYNQGVIPTDSVLDYNRNAIAITRYIKQNPDVLNGSIYEETKVGFYIWYKDEFRSIQSILNELELKNTELENRAPIPPLPSTSTDGNYTLQATMNDGTITYNWV